jgi:hypothetical protein
MCSPNRTLRVGLNEEDYYLDTDNRFFDGLDSILMGMDIDFTYIPDYSNYRRDEGKWSGAYAWSAERIGLSMLPAHF